MEIKALKEFFLFTERLKTEECSFIDALDTSAKFYDDIIKEVQESDSSNHEMLYRNVMYSTMLRLMKSQHDVCQKNKILQAQLNNIFQYTGITNSNIKKTINADSI